MNKILIAGTEEEIAACFPVMRHLRPHLDRDTFMAAVGRMKEEGYRLVFIAHPDVRAVAGFRRMEALSTGVVLYVDDLVTLPEHRSQGYGKRLLDWLLEQAKKEDCQYLELDSGVKRLDAHRFYEREGMGKTAFHFSIPALARAAWEGIGSMMFLAGFIGELVLRNSPIRNNYLIDKRIG